MRPHTKPKGITEDELAAFLASPVPRTIPKSLLRAAGGGVQGFMLLFGLAFGCFGLFFCFIFLPRSLPEEWALDRGPRVTLTGRITEVSRTNLSINNVKVYAYDFDYPGPAAGRLVGRNYTTGRRWSSGERVTVEVLENDPSVARIQGARLSKGSLGLLFVLVFPLVGYGLALAAVYGGRRRKRLLTYGELQEARVTAIDETAMSVNKRRVFAIRLERIAPHDVPDLTVRTHEQKTLDFARGREADGRPVYILSHRRHPKRALLPEAWLA